MKWHVGLTLCLAFWLSGTGLVRGQDLKETLRNLPEESLGFIVSSRLDQIDDKIQGVAKKLQLPLPLAPLDLAKAALGISKGLNAKGCVAVAFYPATAEGEPVPLIFMPVTDYQEFVAPFKGQGQGIEAISLPDGRNLVVGKKGNHAVLTDQGFKEVLQKALASTTNLGAWAEPIHSWLEENDVSLVATAKGLKQVSKARELLAKAKGGLGPKEEAAFLMSWFEGIDNCLKSVESDVTHAGVATRLDKGGNLVVDARTWFAKGSDLSQRAGSVKTTPGGPLAGLPAGPYIMAMGGVIPPNAMESMLRINVEFVKLAAKQSGADIPADKMRKLEQTMAQMGKGLQSMSFVMRTNKEGENLFGRMIGVMKINNASAYLENYEKMIPEMNALYKDLKLPFLPEVDVKKKTVGKITVLETDTNLLGGKGADLDPMQKKIMETMFGPGGRMKTSVAALDDDTILMAYTGAENLQGILQELAQKKGLKDEAEVGQTMKLLPQGSQWVLLVNPRGIRDMVMQMVNTFAPGAPVQIPELAVTPPIGAGLHLSEGNIILQIVIPAQVIELLGQRLQGGKTS